MLRPTLRRVRSLWLEPGVWTRRLAFWGGGVAVGLAAVAFALAADMTQAGFARVTDRLPETALVVTPLGMGLSVWLTRRLFPGAQGSGIPQAMAARRTADPAQRHRLVSLRIALGKVLLTLLGLGVGASVGREGPTVQVGASLMHAAGGRFGGRHADLLLAGSAAGVAAAFNTPLAGIVFAIEEMGRGFQVRSGTLVLAAVAVAGVAARVLQGDYLYFGQANVALRGPTEWALVPLCGLAGGLAGGWFSRIAAGFALARPFGLIGRIRRHPVLFAMVCGLAVAALGIATRGATYGTGYLPSKALLTGGGADPAFGPAKWLATLLSTLSAVPGGIFSPSLAVGAGLGGEIGALLPGGAIAAGALLGMAAYFSGVVQAPITAFVIVLEMTGAHGMTVPVMLASLIATGVARLIGAEPVYHALARGFAPAPALTAPPPSP